MSTPASTLVRAHAALSELDESDEHVTTTERAKVVVRRIHQPSVDFLGLIPHAFARRHLVLSEDIDEEGFERVCIAPATKPFVICNIGTRLGRPVRPVLGDPEAIAARIDIAYSGNTTRRPVSLDDSVAENSVEGTADLEADLAAAVKVAEQDLLVVSGKPPSVRLVDLILFEAAQREASDVHVQPLRDRTLVRFRLDGALHTVRELPAGVASSVVSRLKVMAKLDVAERRSPQDGRAGVTIGGPTGRRIDLRVSTLPSTFGERVVLRLLDPTRSACLQSFQALGMPADLENRFLAQASRSSGIVLSTGPTGSGKTTTLYTTLAWISSTNAGRSARGCELNMLTIEDPVEYDLSSSGIAASQTQVDPKKNVTFATGLRHVLRQDPDVIMVGEVRDEETAKMAVQASLTGHLVLSTLHTNDAPSAVVRLIDLGVEPFLVASALAAVLGQRLVRKSHVECNGQGCAECMGSGFRGRTGVFELLVTDATLRSLVTQRAGAADLKLAAQRSGMVCLRDAGVALAHSGVTTLSEVTRVIESLDEEIL